MKWKNIGAKWGGGNNNFVIPNEIYSEIYIEVYPNNTSLYTIPFFYVPSVNSMQNNEAKYLIGGASRPSSSPNLYNAYVYVYNNGTNTNIWLQQCNQGDSDTTAKSTIYIWGR